MCGLAGIAGDIDYKLKEAFKDLLLITQLRGRDSTGVFAVHPDESHTYLKGLGTPELLFDRKSLDDRVLKGFPKIVAGHCRSKTVGENTVENAHPYDFENLIGMHNGTLRAAHKLEGHDHRRTDSYALYADMSANGLTDTMTRVDPDGAYALVWWDAEERTLNFLRNDQRPLWFAWTKDKRTMIWASEPWMFGAIARKVDLWDGSSDVEGEADRSPYFPLPTNTHWKFTVDPKVPKADKPLTLHPVREVKAEGRYTVGFPQAGGRFENGVWIKNPQSNGGQVVHPFQKRDRLDDKVDDIGRNQGASTTTTTSAAVLSHSSKTISDFRVGSTRGTNSSRSILSLPQKSLPASPQNSNEESSDASANTSKTQQASTSSRPLRVVAANTGLAATGNMKKASVRHSPALGYAYITDHKSGNEYSEKTFEERTGAVCSFCRSPIGSVHEVHEFINASRGFICTTCATQPKLALVG